MNRFVMTMVLLASVVATAPVWSGMATEKTEHVLRNMARERAHVALVAADKDQHTIERDGHGVFTAALLEAITQPENAPWKGQGFATVSNVFRHLRERFARSHEPTDQMPQYGRLEGEGDSILVFRETWSPPIYRKSWAVVVGINRYAHSYSLKFAVADAQSLADVLTKDGYDVQVLADERASRQAILDTLTTVGEQAEDNDRVVFYFAGMGQSRKAADGSTLGYLVPHDGDPKRLDSTAIPMSALRDISRGMRAKHLIMLLDSDFSGALIPQSVQ